MNNSEYNKIIDLYKAHLQVKKLATPATIRLYLHSVEKFFKFCENFHKDLALPREWDISNIGVRELEAFLKYQMDILKWKRSTIVTFLSGLKSFMNYLTESQYLDKNTIQNFNLPRSLSEIGNQRYNIFDIHKLFQCTKHNSLIGMQQRLLLELIYGLGLTLSKITNIKSIVPELDVDSVRIYFNNLKFKDYPFNQSAINILKSYIKRIDSIDGEKSFWVNRKGKVLNLAQLQNLLYKYFESNNLPIINANELRDLSVKHFYEEGADIRSMQELRKTKQIRRLQSLRDANFEHLKDLFKQKHIRNN